MDTDILGADEELAADLDDAVLNVLGSATPGTAGLFSGDDLNALLLAWRNEAEQRPIPELVDTPTAMAAINLGRAA